MGKKVFLVLFLLVFAVTVILAVGFWDYFRGTVVVPLIYFGWAFVLIIKSVDQTIYWIILLVLIGILAIRKLISNMPPVQAVEMEERRAYLTGRLHFWESHVRRLERGEITAHHAMHDIRSLFLSVLAYKGRLEVLEAERRLLDGDLDIPQIQALAQYMREPESGSPDLLMRIKYGLLSLLQRRRAKSKSAQELALANLIQFMEEQLEITHDNGNR